MSTRSPLIDQLIQKAQNRIFLDIGHAAIGVPGWSVMDTREGAAVRHDPLNFPWPLANESTFYIRCMGFVQHIPQACHAHPRDPFLELFDEFWRVLLPGGRVWITTPHATTEAAWGDPTNRRMLTENTFEVLNRAERDRRGLAGDYCSCNFTVSHGFTWDEEGIIKELHVELLRPEEGD